DEGRRLTAAFTIGEAGLRAWWLELRDPLGFEESEPPHYELRGIQDFEPEIYIEQPASDLQVTGEAVVPVRTVARDDLGIKEIRRVFKVESSDAEEQTVSLFAAGSELPASQTAEYTWKISELRPRAGARIVFHTEATDGFDLSPEFTDTTPAPHVGRSVTR